MASAPTSPEPSLAISSRCSFDTLAAFHAAESELLERQHQSQAVDIRRRPTRFVPPAPAGAPARLFVAAVRVPSKYELQTEAARRNDDVRTPYKPPSDHSFRLESPPPTWSTPGVDFQAKFRIPSNQDIRRRVALDQEGFFGSSSASSAAPPLLSPQAATSFVPSDLPSYRSPRSSPSTSPERPPFASSVPHTTRKSANVSLRREIILDQQGLLPQLQDIRRHQYRDETAVPPTPGTPVFQSSFHTAPSRRHPMGGGELEFFHVDGDDPEREEECVGKRLARTARAAALSPS
ncbi:hypothetical protein ATCC90586_007527 [Pythium insidiosum]|nr:hypothetical protein ATCC90586_007527 [Pythium insidiosum]